MGRTWSTLPTAPPQWGNIEGIPIDLLDGMINWGEVGEKPLDVVNLLVVPGGFDFVNGIYRNLGNFPIPIDIQAGAQNYPIFLIQLCIQWSAENYHNIIGSSIFSNTTWLVHPWERVERSIICESHFSPPTIATFYVGEGAMFRDFYLKIDRNLNIPIDGKVNIKIVAIV